MGPSNDTATIDRDNATDGRIIFAAARTKVHKCPICSGVVCYAGYVPIYGAMQPHWHCQGCGAAWSEDFRGCNAFPNFRIPPDHGAALMVDRGLVTRQPGPEWVPGGEGILYRRPKLPTLWKRWRHWRSERGKDCTADEAQEEQRR